MSADAKPLVAEARAIVAGCRKDVDDGYLSPSVAEDEAVMIDRLCDALAAEVAKREGVERDLAGLVAELEAAGHRARELVAEADERADAYVARYDRLERTLADCAVNQDSPDCCGVCKLHFADCERERTIEPDGFWCAGARARAALAAKFPATPTSAGLVCPGYNPNDPLYCVPSLTGVIACPACDAARDEAATGSRAAEDRSPRREGELACRRCGRVLGFRNTTGYHPKCTPSASGGEAGEEKTT